MYFSKAPLVEIIAELRWVGSSSAAQTQLNVPGFVPIAPQGTAKLDEFFAKFGSEIFQAGFQRSEKIMPPGFPPILFQPAYRYRPIGDQSDLVQIGAGMFSANAVPPYRSWKEFSPMVSKSIDILLSSRVDEEKALPFSSVTLRYIDAFGVEYFGGKTSGEFIREILGFSIVPPKAISNVMMEGGLVTTGMQLSMPIENNLVMNINVGDGMANGSPAVILDTTVSCNSGIEPTEHAGMSVLNSSCAVIHKMFFNMTQPLHPIMQPREG